MTTLLDAQVEFEREFKSVRHDPKAEKVLYLYGGGLVDDPIKTPPPCLCSTQDMAIALWLLSARHAAMPPWDNSKAKELWPGIAPMAFGSRPAILTWRALPKMLKFQMTMTGKHNQDRVVTDRYAVYSEAAFSL